MIRVWFLPVIAVVLSFTFPQVFGTLKCWQCDSDKNPDCGDPFNAAKIASSDHVECKSIQNLGSAYCVKAVVINSGEHDNTRHVRRMCADAEFKANTVCNHTNCTVQFSDKCSDDDGCNAANQYSPLAIIRIFVPIIVVKLFAT